MMEMSHQVALPIQRFWPLRIQVSPSRLAVVVIPPLVPEPTRGSVKPKQPIFSQRAIGGLHFFFFFFEPPRERVPIDQPLWSAKNEAVLETNHPHSLANHTNHCRLFPPHSYRLLVAPA